MLTKYERDLREQLGIAVALIEAFYGRGIERAYQLGDASREERDCVVRARALLRGRNRS